MAGGVFAVHRGVFDHPLFADEPFTEREAWLWLLSEAAWKPRRVRVRNGAVQLQRGQLAHATRFMAKRWKWSEARVRRFLRRLKTDAMIDAQSDAQATRITICKYDEYQIVAMPGDAQSDAQNDAHATRKRRKLEEREDNTLSKGDGTEPSWRIDFDMQFWPAYEKDKARREALDAFIEARKKVPLQTILEGVERLKAATPDETYRPLAHNWLNGERWNDRYSTAQPARRAKPASGAETNIASLGRLLEQVPHDPEGDGMGRSDPEGSEDSAPRHASAIVQFPLRA